MYGFVLKWGQHNMPAIKDKEREIQWGDFACRYNAMPRFENDKIFVENESLIILLDGAVYNKNEIMEEYAEQDWIKAFSELYYSSKDNFMDKLRGPFRGFVLEKEALKLTVFTNHSGEKTVFYTQTQEGILIATDLDYVKEVCSHNSIVPSMNLQAANELLTLGYVVGKASIMENVHRLMAGEKLSYSKCDNVLQTEKYWFLRNTPELEITDDTIAEFDRLYRQAVNRIFAKAKEYGYRYEADMSGGLDTRMVNWVAHDLGYNNVVNINYCHPNCLDYKIAKKISKDLGNELVYYTMENGDFLKDIDEMVGAYSGQVIYFISTGANRSYKKILDKNIGIASTGLLGELCNAYLRVGNTHTKPEICVNRYSRRIELNTSEYELTEYDNYEQCNNYLYCYGFILKSGLIRNQWFEFASPYIDKDFAEFAFRISLKERIDFKFYTKWILTCYPNAGKYVWQTKKRPLDKKFYLPAVGWKICDSVKRVVNKGFRILRLHHQFIYTADMNPFNAWYESNESLREFVKVYYQKTIDLIEVTDLKKDIETVFEGNGVDKLVAINMLAINKRYFVN